MTRPRATVYAHASSMRACLALVVVLSACRATPVLSLAPELRSYDAPGVEPAATGWVTSRGG